MSYNAIKWIFTGLGWAMGGPIGGFLGYIIGASLFKEREKDNTDIKEYGTNANNFTISLLIILTHIMKADKKILKVELNYIKDFLLSHYTEQETLEFLKLIKEFIKNDIPIDDACAQIRKYMSYNDKLLLVEILFKIAYADGEIHEIELQELKRISGLLGLSDKDFDSVYIAFDKNSYDPYKILNVSRTATNEDIKKAYRDLVKENHPDKYSHLGESYQKEANEKLKKINEAYEKIKKERSIA